VNRVFVDTSAILALLVSEDRNHHSALEKFNRLRAENKILVCNSYILVETYAIVGRRMGLDAVTAFRDKFAPLLSITWVDEELHEAGLDRFLAAKKRQLSLVDAVSFIQMMRQNIQFAFSFDAHFSEQEFFQNW
jgi:predicted nucleic acid-binding protein